MYWVANDLPTQVPRLHPAGPVAVVQATLDSVNVFRVVGFDQDAAPYVLTGKGLGKPHGWDDADHGGWILEPEWPGIQFGCHWRGDIDAYRIPFGVVLRARAAASADDSTWPAWAWQGSDQAKVVGSGSRSGWEPAQK